MTALQARIRVLDADLDADLGARLLMRASLRKSGFEVAVAAGLAPG